MSDSVCPLCRPGSESVLWYNDRCRVIEVGGQDYPGYVRVIWNAHVREMSDLVADERQYLYQVVDVVEAVLREVTQPDKINLASLGNQVPHLHWHVIPRFTDDPHFPDPIWAARRRDPVVRAFDLASLQLRLARRLAELR